MATPQPAHEAASNFLVPNATFIAEFIAFLIILFLLGRYVYPPIQKATRDRQAVIRKQIEDAEAAAAKLAEAQAEYQRALTEARTQAGQIRENARAEAQNSIEELRTRAQEESERIIARGEEKLANQRGAIVRELRGEIGSLAVELSEKIVSERLADDARVSATVDSFLAELERRDAAGAGKLMQAASREALATLRENVIVGASAKLSVDAVIARVDELYAAAALLTIQPQLRRAIGDAAAATAARTDLVAAVFTGRVSAPVLELTQAAAAGRWSDPWDLVDSLETVGDDMTFAVAEQQGALDEVEDELFRFERILDAEGQLSTLLDDPNASAARRIALLDSLLAGKVHRLTKSLLDHAVESLNKRTVGTSVHNLLDMAGERRSRSVARVLSAIELTSAQQQRLASALSELYGRPITVLTAVDASVRGGLVVRVGDEIIDGSVASRLASVRNALAS